jgi:glycosyltransferase involved in cell wall biosynthesis
MKPGLVSVIIPVYNSERYVSQAIESALQQSYADVEIIVVDDGSVDGTAAILKRFETSPGVRVLRHSGGHNRGVSRSRQLGVSASAGEFVAFLDADDLFSIDKLNKQVDALTGAPEIVLCHGGVNVITTEKETPDFAKAFNIEDGVKRYRLLDESYAFQKNQICNSSVMVRRESLSGLRFDSDQLFQYEDWLLWLLLAEKGEFLFLPGPLVNYRYHLESATSGVVAKPLKHHYSLLEMHLSLLTRLSNERARARLLAEMRRNLLDLVATYSPQSDDPECGLDLETVSKELFTIGSEDISAALALTVYRLETEMRRLSHRLAIVESSRICTIVRGIRERFSRLRLVFQGP